MGKGPNHRSPPSLQLRVVAVLNGADLLLVFLEL